jgi:quercetin dioxygenase-like cupin family protein
MTRKRIAAIAGVALIAVTILVLNVLPSAAETTAPPIAAEPLTDRAVFPDNVTLRVKVKDESGKTDVVKVRNPSRTVTARYTVQPGAHFPWHSHAGPVVVNVVSGQLTYVDADNCEGTTYPAGTAFFDLGRGHVHSAFNGGNDVTVLVATFFRAPADGPLLIPADPACP